MKTKSKLVNTRLADFLSTTNGRLVASLVREFLEFFSLDYTLAVFDPETNIGRVICEDCLILDSLFVIFR